ncbi:alcohol dehydrogenase [Actinotalea ferrariae CF5-4]|uniref:Alcohol dehydrogenase n=1 Tax=Actinotalea ferrariae CF5-4 TaxID=948458 RepID=A0A021VUU7_9CELL|nr:NADP-dependent oxidoreductase [Actinotalea ferrariae]EYR63835.1 alcohol dehydrogenase [Actinotalea ferrariae CF5-4]
MVRSVVATAYGGPEVLAVVETDVGAPGPGEVLLDVKAAGVNPADWKTYNGTWGSDPAKLPLRLGLEVAGVVAAVGPDVEGLAAGDEVIGWPVRGAYADRVVVKAETLVARPPSLEWAPAGGLLLTGTTAWHAVTAVHAGAGDTLLVHGAAGGVGAMVVQLARLRGARVVGTASAANHEHLVELGALPVTYGPGLADRVRAVAPKVTAAVDTVGTDEALDVSLELVGDRRRVATVANFHRGPALGIQVLGHGPGADPGTTVRADARRRLVEMAGDRRLRVHVGATYHLADVARAHRAGIDGVVRGKIVLVP